MVPGMSPKLVHCRAEAYDVHAGAVGELGTIDIASEHQDPTSVERLLRALPDWFGIEEALAQYVRDAESAPTYLATNRDTGEVIAALLMRRHYPESAEIHLMAVDPQWHRCGVGRALVEAVEHDLVGSGARILQVKTLGPSEPDQHYAGTLAFYQAVGFVPLQEFREFWPGNPCLILVKSLVNSG
jgi:GNAT superfamily N-acetyltransferase